MSARAECHLNVETFIQSREIELNTSFPGLFCDVAAWVAAYESGEQRGKEEIFVPSTPDFCTHHRMGRQTGSIKPDKFLRVEGHSASCGRFRAGRRIRSEF